MRSEKIDKYDNTILDLNSYFECLMQISDTVRNGEEHSILKLRKIESR